MIDECAKGAAANTCRKEAAKTINLSKKQLLKNQKYERDSQTLRDELTLDGLSSR